LNEKNPKNTAAACMSEKLDLSAPDRVDDQLYNRILWLMLKGDVPRPVARSHAAQHTMQLSKMMMSPWVGPQQAGIATLGSTRFPKLMLIDNNVDPTYNSC
jgi:hypothetical protein